MKTPHAKRGALILLVLAPAVCAAAEPGTEGGSTADATVTGYYYAMRDQPDYGVGVAAMNRGALHLEARYNYEALSSASIFAGWNIAGGNAVTFQVTPILGALFGDVHGVVPGVEASVAYREFDFYIETEYVHDLGNRQDSYWYAWSELGWRPVHWLRIGLVGQRSREVETGRDLQRGAFIQLTFEKWTLGLYGFNPESESRYLIVSLGAQF